MTSQYNCYTNYKNLKLIYEINNDNHQSITDVFKLMTYDIDGKIKNDNHKKLFDIRSSLLINSIEFSRPDLLCLQNVDYYSYNKLKSYFDKYIFSTNISYLFEVVDEMGKTKSKFIDLDLCFISKYIPKSIKVYSLPGIMTDNSCMMIIEFSNIIVINLDIQTYTNQDIDDHYSKCRFDLLKIVYELIETQYDGLNVILCGNFNFDLDDDKNYEFEMLNKIKKDLLFDDLQSGLTVNSDTNYLRWNQNLIDEKSRIHGILYRSFRKSWSSIGTKLVGLDNEYLSYDNSKWFYNNMSKAKNIDQLKGLKLNSSGTEYYIPFNPSTNYGVISMFKIK
jgi:hypothetical protein